MKKIILFLVLLCPFLSDAQGVLNAPGTNSLVHIIKLDNRELDVFIGDSYTAGEYNTKGLNYLSNLSTFTDRNIENYALSGNTLADMYTRITNDAKSYHSTLGIKEYASGGYAFISSWRNEFNSGGSMYNSNTMTSYLAWAKKVADAAKGLGYKPVITTENFTTNTLYGTLVQATLSQFCTDNGYLFADIAATAAITIGPSNNSAYWYGSHPGVRTNTTFYQALVKYIQSLPRPKSSIKIFRKRASYSISGISNLLYSTTDERTERFKEIYIGQYAIADNQERYYDDLTTLQGLGTYTNQLVNDYLKLQNGENVAFSDYALVETVVNGTSNNINSLSLNIKGTSLGGATVYVKDWVNDVWVSLSGTLSNGTYSFTLTSPKNQIRYDKASFLIYNGSGFNLNGITVTWFGKDGKDISAKPVPIFLNTPELLAYTNISLPKQGWTTTGIVTPFIPSDSNIPLGAHYVVPIDTINYLSQVVTFPSEVEKTRKVQVKVIARRNPPVYSSSMGGYPSDAYITSDTWNFRRIRVRVTYDANNIVSFEKTVGLHWYENLFEFDLPPNVSTATVAIQGIGNYLELATASVKVSAVNGSVVTAITTGANKNLFNPATAQDGFYIETDGNIFANASYGYSDFIPVISGQVYVGIGSGNGMRKTTFYYAKDAKSVVAGGNTSTSTSFVAPLGAAFVRVSYFASFRSTFQLENNTVSTAYDLYSQTINSINGLPIKQNVIGLVPTTKNIFNAKTITAGQYIDGNSGTATTNATFGYSELIPVVPGATYYGTDGTNIMRHVAYYNANTNFVTGGIITATNSFTVPVGVYYVRISVWLTGLFTFQLELGESATIFMPYIGGVTSINGNGIINATGALFLNVNTGRTSNYTTTAGDCIIQTNSTDASFNITLLSTAQVGQIYVVDNGHATANSVTLIGTIDGVTNYILNATKKITLYKIATSSNTWGIISNN